MKIMSKHTPGPWRYEYSNDVDVGPEGDEGYSEFFSVTAADETEMARVYEEADASLIAAAPDMLEALRIAAATLERALSPGCEMHGLDPEAHSGLQQIRTAITKAEGR